MYKTDMEAVALIESAQGYPLSDEQKQVILSKGGLLVVSCAGSGKTTTLVNLILKRVLTGEIQNPGKLLITTYSVAGAKEISKRLYEMSKKIGYGHLNFDVKTMHSFYYSILKRLGYSFSVLSGAETTKLVQKALSAEKVFLEYEDLQTLEGLFSYQVNNLLSDNDFFTGYAFSASPLGSATYMKVREMYAQLKLEQGKFDFDDLQLFIYSMIMNPANEGVVTWLQQYMYDAYFIDETQDTSKIQSEILKKLVKDSRNLVFIGDDDQCVYEWRGASPSGLLKAPADYNLRTYNLSTNYRCGSNIVNFAEKGIRCNKIRYEKELKAFGSNGCGDIKLHLGSEKVNLLTESKLVVKDILTKLAQGNNNSVAILVRNNKHAAILTHMLSQAGVRLGGLRPSMCLTNSIEYVNVMNYLALLNREMMKLLAKLSIPTRIYAEAGLVSLVERLPQADGLNDYVGISTLSDGSKEQAFLVGSVQYMSKDLAGRIITCMIEYGIQSLPVMLGMLLGSVSMTEYAKFDKFSSRMESLGKRLKNAKLRDSLRQIINLLFLESCEYRVMENYKQSLVNGSEASFVAYIDGLLKDYVTRYIEARVDEISTKNVDFARVSKSIYHYLQAIIDKYGVLNSYNLLAKSAEIDTANSNSLVDLSMMKDLIQVEVTTLHSAKGLEWDNVYYVACDSFAAPNVDRLSDLMEACENGDKHSKSEYMKYIAEGRRLHYVALTRAKKELNIYTTFNYMSPFLIENLGVDIGTEDYLLGLSRSGNLHKKHDDNMLGMVLDSLNRGEVSGCFSTVR